MAFTSLNHYLDVEWLRYAFECTRKDGAVGADGRSGEEYALDLERNLTDLLDRLKSGRYRAPPVRRHYIAKPDGGKRALGIPSFEDKVVAQRAITMLLEPIYEQDFLDCSFGYRAGRNAHQALQVLRKGVMEQRGYWVVEVDVRKYFDSIPRTQLRECLARRVSDGVVRRLIEWLKAGVLEAGQVHYPEAGSPHGGVISPLLSNIFLHYAIDAWFADEVRPRLRAPGTLVRFCDDMVMLFAHRADAERVLAVPGKRLERFGLQLHPEKSRLVDFRSVRDRADTAVQILPTTFVFLGFLHLWGCSRYGKRASVHGQGTLCALARGVRPTVPANDALATSGAARAAVPDAQGALRLLRHLR